MPESDLAYGCDYCDADFATIDEANMHEREHPADLRRSIDARRHYEEWGHELDGPECAQQRQRERD